MREIDWYAWHRLYDDPSSKRAQRMGRMQEAVLDALRRLPPGPIRLLSVCAGQGREVAGALDRFDRPGDVAVTMLERDERNAEYARDAVRAAGAGGVEVVGGDAGRRANYDGRDRVDLLLLCGVFGGLTLMDSERAVALASAVTRPGGLVVWTRHRGDPDRIPLLGSWFEAHGLTEVRPSDPDEPIGIVTHRLTGEPGELPAGDVVFTFRSGVVPEGPVPVLR